MFIVTKEWMEKYKSPGGGYVAAQLRQLGEHYPLQSGWLQRCLGKQITEDQKSIFEAGAVSKSNARRLARKLKKNLNESFDAKAYIVKKNKKEEVKQKENKFVCSDSFLSTYEWRKIRMQALKKYGPKCMCCGATPEFGAIMNVDHIKPRKLFPSLALDLNNLQILCNECNHGKGNWDMTDWRKKEVQL